MPLTLRTLQTFEDKRVRMRFDDGVECVATIRSVSADMDGSLHVVYDSVESSSDLRDFALSKDSAVYAEGESLVSIESL